jgi:Pretoxin HINT domain
MRIEGERAPLRPSTSHPFWVKRGESAPGWLPAAEIRLGDLVQSMQGAWRMVVAIAPLPGQETVYNFTVDQNHDYFVGEQGLLVHNQSAGSSAAYETYFRGDAGGCPILPRSLRKGGLPRTSTVLLPRPHRWESTPLEAAGNAVFLRSLTTFH